MTNEHVEKYRGNGVANRGQFGRKFSNAEPEMVESRVGKLVVEPEPEYGQMIQDVAEQIEDAIEEIPEDAVVRIDSEGELGWVDNSHLGDDVENNYGWFGPGREGFKKVGLAIRETFHPYTPGGDGLYDDYESYQEYLESNESEDYDQGFGWVMSYMGGREGDGGEIIFDQIPDRSFPKPPEVVD